MEKGLTVARGNNKEGSAFKDYFLGKMSTGVNWEKS